MKMKTSIAAGLAILLTTIVSVLLIPTLKVSGNRDFVKTEIPVVIKPLTVENRTVPIEIQCDKVFVTSPDTVDSFSCTLINKTNMSIGAAKIEYSFIAEGRNKVKTESFSYLAIANIHPDVPTLIKPNETLNISPSGPKSSKGGTIKGLELEPTFIEFVEGTAVGVLDNESKTKIENIRKGAEMYKSWIKKEYVKKGKSENALITLLENESELYPLDTDNSENKFGANYYKNFLSKRFKEKGQGSIKDVLDQ